MNTSALLFATAEKDAFESRHKSPESVAFKTLTGQVWIKSLTEYWIESQNVFGPAVYQPELMSIKRKSPSRFFEFYRLMRDSLSVNGVEAQEKAMPQVKLL